MILDKFIFGFFNSENVLISSGIFIIISVIIVSLGLTVSVNSFKIFEIHRLYSDYIFITFK